MSVTYNPELEKTIANGSQWPEEAAAVKAPPQPFELYPAPEKTAAVVILRYYDSCETFEKLVEFKINYEMKECIIWSALNND